jgi:hypothetical protein
MRMSIRLLIGGQLVRFQPGAPEVFREDVGKRSSRQIFNLEIAGSNPAVLTKCPVGPMDQDASLRNSRFRFESGAGYQDCGPVGELESPVPCHGTDRRFESDRVRQNMLLSSNGTGRLILSQDDEGSTPFSNANWLVRGQSVCPNQQFQSTECRSGRGGGLQTRSYPVRVRISAPMPEWRNAYALVLETSSFGSESSILSSGTKSLTYRGCRRMAAEPSRKRWTGDEPVGFDPSTLCHKPGCSWESSQPPKLAHSVRITAPVPTEGEADGKPPHC